MCWVVGKHSEESISEWLSIANIDTSSTNNSLSPCILQFDHRLAAAFCECLDCKYFWVVERMLCPNSKTHFDLWSEYHKHTIFLISYPLNLIRVESVVEHDLLDIIGSLHTWTNGSYYCMHKPCPRSSHQNPCKDWVGWGSWSPNPIWEAIDIQCQQGEAL